MKQIFRNVVKNHITGTVLAISTLYIGYQRQRRTQLDRTNCRVQTDGSECRDILRSSL